MSKRYRVVAYSPSPETSRSFGEVCELVGGYAAHVPASEDAMPLCDPFHSGDLRAAHERFFREELSEAGAYRERDAKIVRGVQVLYVPPPPSQIAPLMADLFGWLAEKEEHPLLASCIFHYQLLLIQPFADGNGRLARRWQGLLLAHWRPQLAAVALEDAISARKEEYLFALRASDRQKNASAALLFLLDILRDELRRLLEDVRDALPGPLAASEELPRLTEFAERLLSAMGDRTLTGAQIMRGLAMSHRGTFRKNYMDPALEAGYVEMTQPDSPRSPTQKYRLTPLGLKLRNKSSN